MNLGSFCLFSGVRINGLSCASAAKERGKEKDVEMGRPGESDEPENETYGQGYRFYLLVTTGSPFLAKELGLNEIKKKICFPCSSHQPRFQ